MEQREQLYTTQLREIEFVFNIFSLSKLPSKVDLTIYYFLELYRATVIRNLPQLQKLDNVVVQPDELADALRRGVDLIHPMEPLQDPRYTRMPSMPPQVVVNYQQNCSQICQLKFTELGLPKLCPSSV